jgi:transposase
MVMYAKIRRMYFREKQSVSAIARKTSLSRNTIKKWLRVPGGSETKYRRSRTEKIVTAFEPWLLQALKVDAHRPKRDRRTARMLFQAIRTQGFSGSYCRVTELVSDWRARGDSDSGKSAFVPLKFKLGEAFQFDWSEESLVIGGMLRKVIASHTKLCSSRAFFISGYPGQSHEMLFDAHNRAFAALGGVAKRGIYDNMKTAVDKVSRGNGRIVNTRFYAMVSHYLFEADFCNVASGWEKGIVEKNVQDARRRIWIAAKQQQFSTFEDLNVWLEARCRALWAELEHPDTAGITVADALEQEQPYLMPMPTPFDGYVETTGRVSSTCLISVDKNRYSVPCHLANRMVSIHLYADRVAVYDECGHVASHRRLPPWAWPRFNSTACEYGSTLRWIWSIHWNRRRRRANKAA